jgi:photosystem II stability/assembly factor-like uncharacterized protein
MDKISRGKRKPLKKRPSTPKTTENWDPLIIVLSSQPTTSVVQELLDRLGARGVRGRKLLENIVTRADVPPTDVPPTDVPPTDVPPTDVPPTDVPPTDVPPTDVPPTDVPPTDVPPTPVPEEDAGTTTHKNRADWFGQRFSYPVREADVQPRLLALKPASKDLAAAQESTLITTSGWNPIGPSNFGGRTTSLVCDPNDPKIIYAGSAGGGIWRSRDAGKSWRPLWDNRRDFHVLSVGSLAITTDKQNIRLYAGTGEANLSSDNYPGIGVYMSNDGDKWYLLPPNGTPIALPPRIGAIAVDPAAPDRIFIGGVCHSDDDSCGMYVFDGEKWAREGKLGALVSSDNNYYCHSIVFSSDGKIFTGVDARGSQSGIWRYKDNRWEHLTKGLPPGDQFARTSLAVARSQPNVIYALASDRTGGVLGVFRSEDEGERWSEIGNGRFRDEGQMSYNNCIAVHPENPDYVIWGGIELHRTKDGGNTWQTVTDSSLSKLAKGSTRYVHQDHHALLIVPQAEDILVYDGNDGGVSVSEDGGDTWDIRSRGLGTTMFYDIDVAQGDSKGRIVAGGTQDNGTLMTNCARLSAATGQPSNSLAEFRLKVGGDGGWVIYDPTDTTHFYASSERMHIYRRRVGVPLQQVTPPGLTADERDAIWMAFIEMDSDDPNIVFTASDRVWRTLDDGKSWRASRSLDGSPVSAIEVATKNHRRIYAGTENGGFFRSLDGGDTWSQNMAGAVLPGRIITRIETRPSGEDAVYVTVGSVGTVMQYLRRPYEVRDNSSTDQSTPSVASPSTIPFSHVFRSPDGGETWEDADPDRTLPNVPHLALAFETNSPYRLFVAGDVWIYMLDETGWDKRGKWREYTDNLPSVIITDLVYHRPTKTLSAATYGRGLWSRYVT